MNYLKYTSYIYLAAGIFFGIDAIIGYSKGDENAWLSMLLAIAALFMFIFRKRFARRFDDRNGPKS